MKCNDHSCKNVIIAGDLNTSFDRKDSEHTKHLEYIRSIEGLKDECSVFFHFTG